MTDERGLHHGLVLIGKLKFHSKIVQGLFLLLEVGNFIYLLACPIKQGLLTLSPSSLSSKFRWRVLSFENVHMRCWSSE